MCKLNSRRIKDFFKSAVKFIHHTNPSSRVRAPVFADSSEKRKSEGLDRGFRTDIYLTISSCL